MPKITYVQPDGTARTIDAEANANVMRTAIANNVPGIVAECGGSRMCATCHVYVDAADLERLPEMCEEESDMLDYAAAERRPGSRLSCQLTLDGTVDNLVVHVPESQS